MSLNSSEVVGWRPKTVDSEFWEIVSKLSMGTINGTDISGWQPTNPVLAGDAFSIIKASEGVGEPNANWAGQVDWCRAAGALVGHYHFCNGLNTPQAEAQYFWNIVSQKWQVGEPIALDVEGSFFTNTANPVAWVLACAQELYALSGLKPIIYLDWSHEKDAAYNWQPLVDFNCGLWGAAYNSSGFGDPSPWPSIVLWQNADTNASGGDSDVLYGDASTFKAYGTPQGEDVALTQDDANLVAQTLLNWPLDRQGGPTGQLNLKAFLQWSDANFQGLQGLVNAVAPAVNAHTDTAVKAIPVPQITLTDAQVATLAATLKAELPAAQIQALAAQLQK